MKFDELDLQAGCKRQKTPSMRVEAVTLTKKQFHHKQTPSASYA